jgi:hypothetical protein
MRSGMKRKFHVPFWRAVALVRESLTLIVFIVQPPWRLHAQRSGVERKRRAESLPLTVVVKYT